VDNAGADTPAGVSALDNAIKITTVSSADAAAAVATIVAGALDDALWTAAATDSVVTATNEVMADYTDAAAGDSGFTVTTTTQGAGSALDGKYFQLADVSGVVTVWFDVGNTGTSQPTVAGTNRYLEITTIALEDTAAQVAGKLRTAIDADSKFDVGTLTDATFTAICKDLKAVTNAAAGNSGFTVSVSTQGADTTSPTGAIWTSIAAGKKGVVDISAATDANSVAVAARAVLVALTGITDVLTVGSVDTANIAITHTVRMNVANPVPKSTDDAGAGSITVAQSTAGVASTVNVTDNTITIASHGFTNGLKGQLTTTGTLPAGVTTSTDYFVIVVDANTISLADSLAHALAGTALDLTNQGATGNTHTFTPTAVAGGVVHAEASNDKVNWFDVTTAAGFNIAGTANVTATGSAMWNLTDFRPKYIRVSFTCTAGQVTLSGTVVQKDQE
jgi:hypothetical protein